MAKYCQDCFGTKESFKMVAVGNLDEDEEMDVWTIDQNKNLIHVTDDL